MDIHLHSTLGPLPLSAHYPNPPAGLLFPGAEMQITQHPEIRCYLFQQFKTVFFTIRYCCFYTMEKEVVTVTHAPGVTFRLGISHSHQVTTTHLGNQVFHERGSNIFYDPGATAEYAMEAGESFIFLELLLAKDYLDYLHYYHSGTKTFIEQAANGIAGKLTPGNQVAQTEIWRWQEELLDWCFDADRKSGDGDIIANKLIVKSIELTKPAPEKRGIALSLPEMNSICNVAEMIRNSDETLATEKLSAGIGLSVYKFNAGFKEIFGHTAGKHKFEDKMSYALRLVDCQGANLKQVATLLGYSQPRMFSEDFRKRFGYAPFEKNKPTP